MTRLISGLTAAAALTGSEPVWVEQSLAPVRTTVQLIADLAAGGAGTFAGLTDTDITSPADAALALFDTGTGNWRDAAMSGDATINDTGSLTVAADAITYAKMQNVVSANRILGSLSAGGIVTELTAANVRTVINVEDGSTADQTSIVGITGTRAQFDTAVTDGNIAYAGGAHHDGFSDFLAAEHVDWAVTGAENLATDRSANAVLTLASGEVTQLANIGATAISAADWIAVAALIGTNTGDQTITLTGDVTGSGTGSFVATIQSDVVTMDKIVDIATDTFLGRVTAATGTVEVLTNAQAKTALDLTGTNSGDQTSIVGITGTKAQFDTAVTDGNIAYTGGAHHDGFSDFVAQEHIRWDLTGAENLFTGRSANAVLALTSGEVTQLANIGGTTITAADWIAVAALVGVNTGDQTSIVGITGTKAQFDTAVTDGNIAYIGGAHHDGFSDFVANEHIRWDLTGGEDIHANRLSSGANMADSLLDRPHISDFAVEHQIVSGIATTTINYVSGQSVLLNMTANITTLNLNNWPVTGRLGQLELEIAQDNPARTITWPASVSWINNIAPDISLIDRTYLVHLRTRDGGTNILGSYAFDEASGHPISTVFGRTGLIVALQADYDSFFLTPTEGNAAYSLLGHSHAAADVVSGTFVDARIPNLNTSKITAGIFNAARIPTHTGEVTGQTNLLLANSAITGQAALTSGLAGTDEFLVADAGVIKRMDTSVFNAYFNANLSFAAVSHNHNASDINAGILAVLRGGSGVSTKTGTGNNVLSASPTLSGTVITAKIAMADSILERPHIDDYAVLHQNVTATTTTTLNYNLGQSIRLTLASVNITTFSVSNWPASGRKGVVEIELKQGATARTINWGSINFPSGVDPDITTVNSRHLVYLTSTNGGTTVDGTYAENLS